MYQITAHINSHGTSGPSSHDHTLQASQLPSHNHIGPFQTETVFEKHDFNINLETGDMFDMESYLAVEEDFLINICDCIVNRFNKHDIKMFKVGQGELLKEKILEFLED